MTRELAKRHHIRLAPEAYGVIGSVCSVTIGVKARARVFAEPQVAAAAVQVLKERAAMTGVPIFG